MAKFRDKIADLQTDGFSKRDIVQAAAEISGEADARIAELEAEVAGLRADVALFERIEAETHNGFCPHVVFDDNGHFALTFDGGGPVFVGDDPPPEEVVISAFVAPRQWRKTLREAIMAEFAELDEARKGGGNGN